MILDARAPEKPAGVLIDTGTGRRIPFARKADFDTGEWEAWRATADGQHILIDEDGRPSLVRGKAIGRLVLKPLDGAYEFVKPERRREVNPEGQEVYKKIYFDVWRWRGESRRCVDERWLDYLRKDSFLDDFVIRRR